MGVEFIFLTSDLLLYLLVGLIIGVIIYATRSIQLSDNFRKVFSQPVGMISGFVLAIYLSVGLLDSVHYQVNAADQDSSMVYSLLDWAVKPLLQPQEKTYSAPFANKLYGKFYFTTPSGKQVYDYPLLHKLQRPDSLLIAGSDTLWLGTGLFLIFSTMTLLLIPHRGSRMELLQKIRSGQAVLAWRSFFFCLFIFSFLFAGMICFGQHYHLLGTTKVGVDVLYECLKSIRTGLLIGSLATLIIMPFAIILGTMAGYFGGWVDDVIQYVYTTLSSIPAVLLIAAAILAMQVYIDNHSSSFPTLAGRSDARLLALCVILGVTSWTNLCRVLRAETMKLREMDYLLACKVVGGSWVRSIFHHVVPNIMHIVIITAVLDFSGLVLAEAVLTYVGIGVDPTTSSWGNMIDSARMELAREPVVWWPLLGANIFMFG